MKAIDRLIEKINRLSRRDKQWLNKKLAKKAPELLAKLNQKSTSEIEQEIVLPAFTKQLAKEPALIIASVLLSENPEWQDEFLTRIEEHETIRQLMKTPLPPATITLISTIWHQQTNADFESMLEPEHG